MHAYQGGLEPSDAGGREAKACPRCGSNDSAVVLQSPDRQYPFAEMFCVSCCAACGLLFQNPRIAPAELGKHYPEDFASYNAIELSLDKVTLSYLKREQGYLDLEIEEQIAESQLRYGRTSSCVNLIPDFVPGGTVYEIGCAAGNRLDLLKRLGWSSCVGNEYSGFAAAKASARGLDVVVGPIESAVDRIPEFSLDAIVGGFVIEHVADPFALTRKLAGKLKSGGQLLLSTVCIESLDFWLYGKYWYNLDLPRHMVFFRKRDLRAMLEPDFLLENLVTQAAPNDFLGSARYRLKDGGRGWRKLMDASLLRLGSHITRPLSYLGRLGFGARICIGARRK